MAERSAPTVSAALVRGLNVGRRWLKMSELRALALGCGFVDVATYIQTGNLLVAAHQSSQEVRQRLERALAQRFSAPIPVAVLTPTTMARVAEAAPVAPVGEVVYVAFWVETPDPDRLAALPSRVPVTADRLTVGTDAVYIRYRHGVHGSPLSNAWLERQLQVSMTSRKATTVTGLVELARTWTPSRPKHPNGRSAGRGGPEDDSLV